MAKHSFNAHRLYQATFLAPVLLKDGLGVTEHRVLEVLARMMADRSVAGTLTEIDTCFPSLLTICRETMMGRTCVCDALSSLIDHSYISKSKIPGRKLHPGRKRNKWENNRYHVVAEVFDTVTSPFGKGYGEPLRLPSVPKPAALTAKDQTILDSIADAEFQPSTKQHREGANVILDLLREKFGQHPTYKVPGGDNIVARLVDSLIAEGDGAERVLEFIGGLSTKSTAAILRSEKLGGYLHPCFTGWLKDRSDADAAGETYGPEEPDAAEPELPEPDGEEEAYEPVLPYSAEEDVDDEHEPSSIDPYHLRIFPVPHHPGENMDQMLAAELE